MPEHGNLSDTYIIGPNEIIIDVVTNARLYPGTYRVYDYRVLKFEDLDPKDAERKWAVKQGLKKGDDIKLVVLQGPNDQSDKWTVPASYFPDVEELF